MQFLLYNQRFLLGRLETIVHKQRSKLDHFLQQTSLLKVTAFYKYYKFPQANSRARVLSTRSPQISEVSWVAADKGHVEA